MEEKKFVGLEGLKYFWTKIETKVVKIIEDEIAQIIANAPEDLDTLKEIADWISTHEDSASAMNTAILANTEAISGKADKIHTHTKSQITDFPTSLKNPNALTINGNTYDGSSAVNAGVQTVANGGTGVTTQADINKAFIGDLEVGTDDVTDGTEFVSSWASDNGFAETAEGVNTPYKRKFSKVWNYIKGKADSIYAASSHTHTKSQITDFPTSLPANGGTADYANRLNSFFYWNNPYNYDATNGVRVYVYKITMAVWFTSILVQIYDDINYARSRKYFLGLWHYSGYGYNVSVTDLGGTINNDLRVWLGNDGNVYLQANVYWTSRISFSYLDDISDVTITKIGSTQYGSNTDLNGNVLFTPLTDPIIDCGAIRGASDLSSASKVKQYLKADVFTGKFQGDVTGNLTGTADKATSVVDYGDTSKTIQIGYAGAGATVDNLSHIAGYLTGGTQIKDVSKSVLQAWLGLSNYLPLSGGTVTGATQFNNYVKLNAWDGYGTGTANLWYDGNNKFVEIQNATDLKLSGVNVSKEGHTHTKSQITDFPTSLPANGGTASSCSGNSATATQLQTARTINIQDSSATYTGTGASFNGSGDATIKLPSTIKANEFKIGDKQQSIAYRSKSFNGYKMHEVQTNALYIEGRELDTGDSGGLAITNDSVTVFGAGDTNGVFRVVNEDKAGDGSETAPAIFNIFKDGKVTMTNRLTAPSATIGNRPVITGTYSASDGILNLYTN